MTTVFCPECNYALRADHQIHRGQQLVCRQCAASFIVAETNPPKLEPVARFLNDQPKTPREAACPECDRPIRFRTPLREGQMITCSRCHAELEVVSLMPLELEPTVPKSRQQKRNQRRGSEAQRRFEQQPFRQTRGQKSGGNRGQRKQRNHWDHDDGDDD